MPHETLTRRTLGGVLWLATGAGVQALIRFLTTLVLARLITPEGFGLVAAAMTVVGLTDVLSLMGVGPALVQMRDMEAKHVDVGFTISLLLGLVLCVSTFFLADWLAEFFRMPALADVVRVLAFLFPIRSLSVVSSALLRRQLAFRQLALSHLVAFTISYAGVATLLAALGFGPWALVLALMTDGAIRTAVALWLSPPHWRFGLDFDAGRELVTRGVSFTLAQIFSLVALKGDNVVVGRWLGAEALGFYTRAYTLMTIPIDLLSSVMQRILFPAMARLQGDNARLASTYKRGISLLAMSLLPIGVLFSVLSDEIIALLFGPAWSAASAPLQLLALGMYFRGSYKMSGTIADATGVSHRNAQIQLVYAILIVSGAWLGRNWGLTGVATAVALVLFVEFLLLSRMALNILGLSWSIFIGLHVRGSCAALLTLGVAGPIAWATRAYGASPLVTAGATVGGCTATALLLLVVAPRALLGPAEIWLTRAMEDQLGHRAPWARRILHGLLDRVAG